MGALRPPSASAILSVGVLQLDTAAMALSGPAGTCTVPHGAFTLLRALMERPGQVMSMEQLVKACWPEPEQEPGNAEAAVKTRVLRAREVIDQVGASGKLLRSIYGAGYAVEGTPHVVRVFTPEQASTLEQLLATHPDAALVAAFATQAPGATL